MAADRKPEPHKSIMKPHHNPTLHISLPTMSQLLVRLQQIHSNKPTCTPLCCNLTSIAGHQQCYLHTHYWLLHLLEPVKTLSLTAAAAVPDSPFNAAAADCLTPSLA